MKIEQWDRVLRLLGVGTAFLLWGVSVYFSNNGFGIVVPEMSWVGLLMALGITVIELVFNAEGFQHNRTLVLAGIAAYGYGIWSNIVGIMGAQGLTDLTAATMPPLDLIGKALPPLLIGIFLEITPEPLMMWALVGNHNDDLLSHLLGRVERQAQGRPIQFTPMRTNQPVRRGNPQPVSRDQGPRLEPVDRESVDIHYHNIP